MNGFERKAANDNWPSSERSNLMPNDRSEGHEADPLVSFAWNILGQYRDKVPGCTTEHIIKEMGKHLAELETDYSVTLQAARDGNATINDEPLLYSTAAALFLIQKGIPVEGLYPAYLKLKRQGDSAIDSINKLWLKNTPKETIWTMRQDCEQHLGTATNEELAAAEKIQNAIRGKRTATHMLEQIVAPPEEPHSDKRIEQLAVVNLFLELTQEKT